MTQMRFAFGTELIVDLFAGGGGASLGIEQAFGRPVDIAINHSADAVALHAANHPHTVHHQTDVFDVDPVVATGGRQVGLLWASPDCKHFSKAKGGKPRSKKIRSLAWVVVKWAKRVRPRVIVLENVEEFVTWGPLRAGQPCPKRKGQTFARWVAQLRSSGYKVEWRELRACDYGAPTIRKRFFLIARCDGLPIRWPAPTHGKPDSIEVRKGKRAAWRTAAECIDWSLPCPSIFLSREEGRAIGVKRPLADATMRRIAKGVQRFVLDAAQPFIVPLTHAGDSRVYDIAEPFRTVTSAHRGEQALISPVITECANASSAGKIWDARDPLRTQCAETKGGHFALAIAHMDQANAGGYDGPGRPVTTPASTITATGAQQRIVATYLARDFGKSVGARMDSPAPTITAGGNGHMAEVRAFLIKFYGEGGQHAECSDPMHTIPTRDRMGLVTVEGTDYQLADIGLRMLTPRELFRAQGFPDTYIIDRGADGRRLSKAVQVRACGNSVCPPIARAIVSANVGELIEAERVEVAA